MRILPLLVLCLMAPLAASATQARTVELQTGARDTWAIGRIDAAVEDWVQTGGASWAIAVQVDVQGVTPDALLAMDVWLVRGGESLMPYNPVMFQGPRTATVTITAVNAPPPDADVLVLVATESVATRLQVRVTINPDLPSSGITPLRPLATGRGAILTAYHEDAAAQATGAPRLDKNADVTDSRMAGTSALAVEHTLTLEAERHATKVQLSFLEAYVGAATGAGEWTATGALGSSSVQDAGTITGTSRTGAAMVGVTGPDRDAAIRLDVAFTADAVPTIILRGSTIPFDIEKAGIAVPRVLWSTHENKFEAAEMAAAQPALVPHLLRVVEA